MEQEPKKASGFSNEDVLEAAISRMHSALSAFYIWKWLNNAININNGKEFAERNVQIMSTYRYFFQQVRVSVYKSFVADLSIFFDGDKYEKAFSTEKLLSILTDKLTVKEIDDLRGEISAIKNRHGIKISLIQELRNADVAHQEIKSQPRKVVYGEIEDLFKAIQEIINLIEGRYNRSSHEWSHIERDVNWHAQWMLENLERGEKMRLKEIDEQYESDVRNCNSDSVPET